jgi:NADPH2:quinone reductase
VVTLLQPPADTDWNEARLRNQRIGLELMLSPMYFDLPEARRHQTEILEQCGRLFDEGKLHVHVAETLPLEQAAEAHRRLEVGGMIGKLVLAIP